MLDPRCVDILYAEVPQSISRKDFEDSLFWWEVEPIKVAGKIVGAMLYRDHEFHIAVEPDARGRWAVTVRRFFLQLLAERGYLIARPFKSNPNAIEFIERVGFKRIDEDENQITLRLDRREG